MPRVAADKRDTYLQVRREHILDAALRVFGEKGFSASSVAEIAAAVGIAKGTIYLYFKSKEELLHAVLNERSFIPELAHLAADDSAPTEETLAAIAERYLDFMADWVPIMRLIVTDARLSARHLENVYRDVIGRGTQMLADYLESQARAGHIRPLENPYLTAHAFWGMLVAHPVTQEILGGRAVAPVDRHTWAREVIIIFTRGLRP